MLKSKRHFGILTFGLMLLVGALPIRAFASESDNSPPSSSRRIWKMSEYLPAGAVLAIASGADGYLWFGTQKGLVRFNGLSYRLFDSENTAALRNNVVQTIFPTRGGELWIGTAGGGAVRLRDNEFTGFSSANGLADDYVQAFCETADGALYFATGKGLNRFDRSRTVIETVEAFRGKTVNALAADANGDLWIGTYGDGIYQLTSTEIVNYTTKNGVISDYVWSFGIDERGSLWIGTRDGISRFDGTRFENFTDAASGYKQTIYAVLPQSNNEILFGTDTAGIIRFDGAKWSADGEGAGLPSSGVYALAVDREANVWAGTLGGAARRARYAFAMLTNIDNLRGSITSAVFTDRRGNLWVGTDKGLNLYREGRFIRSAEERAVGERPVYAIGEDAAGKLFVGTKGGGLFVFDEGRTLNYSEKNGLAGDIVFSVLATRAGKLWIGTYGGGLCELNGEKINCLREKDGLLSDLVSFLTEDADGNLWVVGKKGISRFADGVFTNFPNSENGLPNAEVYAVYQTSDGSIWAGTDGGGLCFWQNGGWRAALRQRDGLASNSIANLIEDKQGFVWLAGGQGVSRVSVKQLKQAANGGPGVLSALAFDGNDGLETANFVGGSQSTAHQDKDGRLWFGTIRGAATINPAELKINQDAPPVRIENLKINDLDAMLGETLTFPPEAAKISFEYAAMRFAAPEKVRFRYKLEGFDRDWIEAGASERTARYTNLPPGNYVFTVSAAENGIWNETAARLEFRKQPFFYQTWWFYALAAAALIIAGIGFYQWRIRRKLAKINERYGLVLRERTRLAREIHDTLTQGLTGISAQLQAAEVARSKGFDENRDNHLKIAGELTGENIAEARQWIRALSAAAPDSDYLAHALRDFARKIERRGGIKLNCRIEDAPLPALPTETAENILRIAQEAVNNAVKHAAAELIEIELRRHLHNLTLRVSDNGCGFDPATVPENGFGQRSMRERAAAVGGQIFIESRTGRGTTVKLIVPLITQNTK